VVTFTTSHIFNRVVEEPFDQLGKRLTRRSHKPVESSLMSVRN
jgi:peptidoglycan/LPS O-acetylase OafA/YrhL